MPESPDESAGIPARPKAPIVLRFVGCDAEMVGLNGDFFTVGDTGEEDVSLPKPLRSATPYKLRFSRAAEGWRLTAAEQQPYYLNQQCVRGLSPLRSGDVIRLAPGAPGFQFAIVHQQAESLARITARFAPRLLRGAAEPAPAPSEATGRRRTDSDSKASPSSVVSRRSPLATALFAAAMLTLGAILGSLLLRPSPLPSEPGSIQSADSAESGSSPQDASLPRGATSE